MEKRYRDRGRGRKKAGFTLIEALIAMTLFAFILITILMVYDSTQQTYIRGEAKVDLQQNVRVAMDQIMHDIRLAGYDPSNAINAQTTKQPFQPVSGTTLSTSELRLIGDVTGDETTDCVGYYLDSTNKQILQRQTSWSSGACTWTATGSAVADNITGLTFTYYPATGTTATTDPAQAKRVEVVITGTSSSSTFTLKNEATLRQ